MSNILILSGSPRIHGNSNILCDEFIRGAQESGNTIEKINVAKLHIAGCLGCNACYNNGGSCVQKDDMTEIENKMLAADIIVLASPIYYYSMSSQLKAVIDRTYSFLPRLSGKDFYYIISCAANEEHFVETMLASLRGFVNCVQDSTEKGFVIGLNSTEQGDVRNSPAMFQAYNMGKNV